MQEVQKVDDVIQFLHGYSQFEHTLVPDGA
jgi:hypothetical protein